MWVSDGLDASIAKDLVAGSSGSAPVQLTPVDDTVYFAAATPATGLEIFMTDGTDAGTKLAFELVAGAASSNVLPVGGVVYSVGEVADVTKEAASALARAGRALYVRREDDASKGGYTASAEILQAAGLAEPPVPVAPPADPGAKK